MNIFFNNYLWEAVRSEKKITRKYIQKVLKIIERRLNNYSDDFFLIYSEEIEEMFISAVT